MPGLPDGKEHFQNAQRGSRGASNSNWIVMSASGKQKIEAREINFPIFVSSQSTEK